VPAAVAIVSSAIEAAPKDYLIPATQEIQPLAVRAVFADNSASGDWLPALQLVAPGGQVMWTAVGTSVAAGGAADVSWFPHVAAQAAAAATTGLAWAYLPGTAKTFAGNGGSGTATTIFSGNSADFYTSDTSVFEAGSTVIGGSTYYGISVKSVGNYLFWPNFQFVASAAGNPVDYSFQYYDSVMAVSLWQPLPTAQVIASLTHNDEIGRSRLDILQAETGDTFPEGPVLYQCVNYTNYAPQALVPVIAIQLDTSGTGL
jgi:hypothetical protein